MTAVAFGVVAFSIVVQGMTMPTLLHRVGEIGGDPAQGKAEATEAAPE